MNLFRAVTIATLISTFLLGCGLFEEEETDCSEVKTKKALMAVNPESAVDIWPFGAHGSGTAHPEGHPGIDLMFDKPQDVKAPISGEIRKVSASEGNGKCYNIVANDKCNVADACFVANKALKAGDSVKKGKVLGKTLAISGRESGQYHIHFGFSRIKNGKWYTASSCDFLDKELLRCKLGLNASQTDPTDCTSPSLKEGGTLMANASYPEMEAGKRTISCKDGSEVTLEFPAETKLCNPRLEKDLKAKVKACLDLPEDRFW